MEWSRGYLLWIEELSELAGTRVRGGRSVVPARSWSVQSRLVDAFVHGGRRTVYSSVMGCEHNWVEQLGILFLVSVIAYGRRRAPGLPKDVGVRILFKNTCQKRPLTRSEAIIQLSRRSATLPLVSLDVSTVLPSRVPRAQPTSSPLKHIIEGTQHQPPYPNLPYLTETQRPP